MLKHDAALKVKPPNSELSRVGRCALPYLNGLGSWAAVFHCTASSCCLESLCSAYSYNTQLSLLAHALNLAVRKTLVLPCSLAAYQNSKPRPLPTLMPTSSNTPLPASASTNRMPKKPSCAA